MSASLQPAIVRVAGLLQRDIHGIALGQPGEMEIWGVQRKLIQRGEGWRTFFGWIDQHNRSFAFNVARNLSFASTVTAEQVALDNVVRQRVVECARLLLECGAILCMPTTPVVAPSASSTLPELNEMSARIGVLTSFAGMAGLPQLNLPLDGTYVRPIRKPQTSERVKP